MMEWSDYDLNRWLDQQDAMHGGDDTFGDWKTKEQWLEWANSMQWDKKDWIDYKDGEMTEDQYQEWMTFMEWSDYDLNRWLEEQDLK
jgi:hypothetical protein